MASDPLYEQDFYAWAMHQAALLREGHSTELDLHHLAAEVESLGQRDKRELRHRLHVLVMHLLQWCDQPAGPPGVGVGQGPSANSGGRVPHCWTIALL